MQTYSLSELIEFDDNKPRPRILVNEPGRRLILLCLRAGQSIPEHSNQERVVVHALYGHVTFYEGILPCELGAGSVVCLESGAPHRLVAHEDSVLFVLAVGSGGVTPQQAATQELDLRYVPRPERHPLVFESLDGLSVGESFVLINDHDPIPLNRQIQQMRPGQVTWEYERREPEMYRIRITRIATPQDARLPV